MKKEKNAVIKKRTISEWKAEGIAEELEAVRTVAELKNIIAALKGNESDINTRLKAARIKCLLK